MLAPDVRAAVTDHLAACPACRQQVALARRLRTVLGPALKEAVGQPRLTPTQVTAMHARITYQARTPRLPLRQSLVGAALLLALLAATSSLVLAQFGGVWPWQHEPTPLSVPTMLTATPTPTATATPSPAPSGTPPPATPAGG